MNHPAHMDAPDRQGRTELHSAAADGDAAEVQRLLDAGAQANLQDASGWSPLHFAAQACSAECVKALLRANADVSLRDAHGNSVLLRAVFASRGDGAVIRLLRGAGADPWVQNSHGVSPVSLARSIANHDVAVHFADLGGT